MLWKSLRKKDHNMGQDERYRTNQSSLDPIQLNAIQSWSAKFLKIISPIQSWSAHVKSCILFCLMRQKHYWSYFAFSQIQLVVAKIVPAVLLRHEEKQTQPFRISKNLTRLYLLCLYRIKHCWSYFAIRRIRLVGLVLWQGRYIIIVRSL